jgi:hypothetical protein
MRPLLFEDLTPKAAAAIRDRTVIVTLGLVTGNDVRHRVRYRGDLEFLASSWQRLIGEAERIELWDEAGRWEHVPCSMIRTLGIEADRGLSAAGAPVQLSRWFYPSRCQIDTSGEAAG